MAVTLRILMWTFLITQICGNEVDNLLSQFSVSNGKFSSDFYSAVIKFKPEENVVISPFSVHVCGALLYLGTANASAAEMAHGLSLLQNDRTSVERIFHAALENHINPFLHVANKIYLRNDTEIKEEFDKLVKTSFLSEEEKVDFGKSEETSEIINNWVKNATHNKINKLFEKDDFDESFFMVLVNTIHFKEEWVLPFEKTFIKPFWTSENKSKDVETMYVGFEELMYAELNEIGATAVQLFYKNTNASMIIILPNKDIGLRRMEEKFLDVDFIELQKRFRENYVFVEIPKFKIQCSVDLKEVFSKMGIRSIFDDINLSNMIKKANKPSKVNKAIHEAFIQVTEEGTEAGAAGGFSGHDTSIPIYFKANRPFFFAILSKSAVLFMGRYVG